MAEELIFILGRDPLEFMAGDISYIRAHARAALRLGFTPHIFCPARRSGVVEADIGVVHRVASPFRPFRYLALPGHAPLVASALTRFLAPRSGPHLLHSFGVWGYVGVIVSERLRRQGVRAVTLVSSYTTQEAESRDKLRGVSAAHGRLQGGLTWAEHLWTKRVIWPYERRTYLESQFVLVNYESVRRLIATAHGQTAPIRHFPYSSETAFLREAASLPPAPPPELVSRPAGDAPLIVTVARQDARKGVDVLLCALAALQDAGVRFRACLVGGGTLLEKHRRLAARLSLKNTVLVGWVPDPYRYLQHADVFALPSIGEGSGSVALLEALQAGAAVVATNVDGIPEDVTDGESALLVEPGNVSALSQALRRVVTDTALREQLRRCARATFEARFSAAALTNALRDIYAELGFTAA
jgi:glycosyltransferase involved in cell wall biosynthesis